MLQTDLLLVLDQKAGIDLLLNIELRTVEQFVRKAANFLP